MIWTYQVKKTFGPTVALSELNLSIAPGELFGLVGPDGAGKTTTLRLLASLLTPSSGEIRVAGLDTRREGERVKEKIGYLPQRFGLYEDLTVEENLLFMAQLYQVRGTAGRRKMEELLRFTGLLPFKRRLAGYLSGGMKQKLALAANLLPDPPILLLDEPTTGVDPLSRRELWHILYSLHQKGKTIVLATPYMDEAERCNRVAFLYQGRVLLAGRPEELKATIEHPLEVLARPVALARERLEKSPEVREVFQYGEALHVFFQPAQAIAAAGVGRWLDQKGIRASKAQYVPPSLEDVFLVRLGNAGLKQGLETGFPAIPETSAGSKPGRGRDR